LFEKRGYKGPTHASAVKLLRQVATAQMMYIRRWDAYAHSAKGLQNTNVLPAAFAAAFGSWQENGDAGKPVAYQGFVFRMLQGDDANELTSYWKDATDSSQGMNTWACIARPADGTGDQFYISEAGTVYRKPDTGKGKFMLDWTLPQSQTEWPVAPGQRRQHEIDED
jgi:hypothetical protein